MRYVALVYCFGPGIALIIGGLILLKLRNRLNEQSSTLDVCGNSFRIPKAVRIGAVAYGCVASAYFFCIFLFAYQERLVAAVLLGSLMGGLVLYPTIRYYLQTRSASISISDRQFVCISGKTTTSFSSGDIESVTLTKRAYLVNLKNGTQKRITRNFVKQFRGFNIIEDFLFALSEK